MRPNRRLLTYVLALAVPLCTWAQTESEPNDNIAQANVITLGTAMTGDAGPAPCTSGPSDDYFMLNLAEDGLLSINTVASHFGANPLTLRVFVYNSAGTQVDYFDHQAGAGSIPISTTSTFTCANKGTYYFRPYPTNGSVCHNYTLTVTRTAPTYADDLEPNNNTTDAQANPLLPANTPTEGHVNFSHNNIDNNDFYRIQTAGDGVLNVTLSAEAQSAGSVRVYAYDGAGTQIDYYDAAVGVGTPASTTQSFNCFGQGYYYLRVWSLNACGVSYQLSYTLTSPVYANDTEPNDVQAQALPLAHNTFTEGHVNFYHYPENADWYAITAPDEGTITVTVIAENAGASIGAVRTFLYNGVGSQIDYFDSSVGALSDDDTTTVSFTCYGQGNYFIKIQSISGCGISYKLKYSMAGAVYANDLEPNNTWAEAAANPLLAHNTFTEGHINFNHYGDNDDRYYIQTPGNGTLRLTTIAERVPGTDGALRVFVHNDVGTQITYYDPIAGGGSDDDTTAIDLPCFGQGNYYLRVTSISGCGISYKLKYSVAGAVYANDLEPNNTWAEAAANPLLAHNTFTEGHINFNHYGDNDDRYYIQTPGNGTLRLTTIAERVPGTDGALRVFVHNDVGTQITYYDPIAGGGSDDDTTAIDLTCFGQGNYYLRVMGISGCGISYKLKYELLPPVYGNDAEPNGTLATAVALNPDSSSAVGHVDFDHYGDNTDYYRVILAASGAIDFLFKAESNAAGSLRVTLYNSVGTQITYQDVPTGAAHVPASTNVVFNGLAAGTYYIKFSSLNACGVSYSVNCNDDDDDGVCNYFDLCAGTPNGEGVNIDGCSCSQVTVDDGDDCTLDECLNGEVTHTFQDADGDLTCDADDGCPNDPDKTSAGACGCGNPDVPTTWYADTDGDGFGDPNTSMTGYTCDQPLGYVANNTDLCDGDINKTSPGACGCGVADTDTDTDGMADCIDPCPNDPTNTCNNCNDPCYAEFGQPTPCATFVDTDEDGTCDATDLCDNDPLKITPGACGCGVVDVPTMWYADMDGDGFGDPNTSVAGFTCNQPQDHVANNTDLCDGDMNKTSPGACGCGVADVATTWYADTDGDGLGDPNSSQSGFTCDQPMGYVADNTDLCPTASGTVGSSCDDGNPNTTGDVLDANCNCVGTPSGCTQNLVLVFDTDANGAETTWELRASGSGTLVQSGGGLPNSANNYTVNTCVPDGCYYLRVLDAGGDGIVGGGYTLRMASGARIIDNSNNFTMGSVSAVIGNGGFCLPLGTDQLIYTSCDKLDWVNNQFIVAAPNAAVSAQWGIGNQTDDGYMFWFFDPNGSYGYAKFRSHATSDGFGPASATRACHARINNWSPNQIPANVLMNVKVRSRVNGVNSAWGPVCRFKIDPVRAACPLTKLMDIPGNANYSCGVTRPWGNGSASKVVAKPVTGATQYQFRFVNAEVPSGVVRTTSSTALQLNWSPALPNGTYEVQVRAYKNGAWCVTSLPWGDVCNVTITGSTAMAQNGGNTVATGDAKLAMFPNPNNGDQLTVSLSAVEEGVGTVTVDIFDLNGARVRDEVIAVNDGMVYRQLDLNELASGLYMVNITAGGQRYTERLVIAK